MVEWKVLQAPLVPTVVDVHLTSTATQSHLRSPWSTRGSVILNESGQGATGNCARQESSQEPQTHPMPKPMPDARFANEPEPVKISCTEYHVAVDPVAWPGSLVSSQTVESTCGVQIVAQSTYVHRSRSRIGLSSDTLLLGRARWVPTHYTTEIFAARL